MKSHRPPRPARPRQHGDKSPYFLQPGKGGVVSVFHRPVGNRAAAKLCGSMPSRALALALVQQLERAESAVSDLFLEATDDGIEALEAVLQACCNSVMERAARKGDTGGGGPRRRHPRGRQPGRGPRGPRGPHGSRGPDAGGSGEAPPSTSGPGPESRSSSEE